MEILEELKNKLDKNQRDTQVIFYEISKKLMNNYVLKIGEIEIELCEIEFYYFDCKKHSDKKTLQHDLQKTTGKLFFHDYGMDLTFGDTNFYGGILIRGIKCDDKYIAGSQNLLDYLKNKDTNIEMQAIELCNKNNLKETIVHSTRIMGKKTNVEFLNKLYRFINYKYLKASPSKDFFKRNLPEISKIKVISSMSGLIELKYNKDEEKVYSQIKQDSELLNNIELFKTNFLTKCPTQ